MLEGANAARARGCLLAITFTHTALLLQGLCCSMMQSTWRNLIKTRRCALPSTCRIRMLLSH
jgi:hypothetical protein